MDYIVIEIQKGDGLASTIVNVYSDMEHASQQYHTILAAASVSTVPVHSAAILNEQGRQIKYECYMHEQATEE
ncbi:MAG: hypothetical protein II008_03915 [Oscillospiraceae bacterium]|nr:hypothetical protein [Oscillospiraceae bacterium]